MSKNESKTGTNKVKSGLAQMLKGGVIMDVTTPEQAIIAQDAGKLAEYSAGIGNPMKGIEISTLSPAELLSVRGW